MVTSPRRLYFKTPSSAKKQTFYKCSQKCRCLVVGGANIRRTKSKRNILSWSGESESGICAEIMNFLPDEEETDHPASQPASVKESRCIDHSASWVTSWVPPADPPARMWTHSPSTFQQGAFVRVTKCCHGNAFYWRPYQVVSLFAFQRNATKTKCAAGCQKLNCCHFVLFPFYLHLLPFVDTDNLALANLLTAANYILI